MSTPTTTPDCSRASREAILGRLREGLRVAAPPPHVLDRTLVTPTAASTQPPAAESSPFPTLSVLPADAGRPWLPDGGETPGERLAILVDNLEKLRAVVHRCGTTAEATISVAQLTREADWQRIAWHNDPLVAEVIGEVSCETYLVDSSDRSDKRQLQTCDAGISSCELLVAQTGSILASSRFSGGRGLSILPPVHVVIARAEQIVSTLGDALEVMKQQHGGQLPSMLSFITGPSRTGDIERILVLGAHGPKELHVVLIDG